MNEDEISTITVKAVQGADWELDVLGVPFGTPENKDSQGEYFTAATDLELDSVTPLVHYYHGYDVKGKPQGKPEKIGTVVKAEKKSDGVWYRVVLDKASKLAKLVWESAKKGLARASSGTAPHLSRTAKTGEIEYWPVFELSLFETENGKRPANQYAIALPALKAMYDQAGIALPDILRDGSETETEAKDAQAHRADVDQATVTVTKTNNEVNEMTPEEIQAEIAKALKAEREQRAAEVAAQAETQAKIDAAVKAEKDKWEADAAKANRLPTPTITDLGEIGKFDNLGLAEMDAALSVMQSGRIKTSDAFLKAYGMRAEADAAKDKGARIIDRAIKAIGLKANELNYSTYSSYGSNWVGTAYANQIWESIRQTAGIVNRIPQEEIPDGYSSKYWPLESTDPTWYKVAEGTADEDTVLTPATTVTSSVLGTGSKQITLGKLGARVMYSGEMTEDSLIAFAPQLQSQLQKSGAEILEHVIIDGDNDLTASTNINDIAGTPAGTEPFTLWDGMRAVALLTSGQNRSASGGLTEDDYLDTLKLLGVGGINALDPTKCAFIVDINTYWASLKIDSIKTKDINSAATLEKGELTRIWNREVLASAQMHRASSVRKANSAGKVDVDTVANNAYGAILAVRFDQWKFANKRRMTMELTRYARADAYEIVALMRCGLGYRDTTAAGITYYVGI